MKHVTSATSTTSRKLPADTRLAFIALIVGGFGIGVTEFVTMGLLPQIAEGMDVTIPQAGHVVSAYAVGVVVGAPLLAVVGARFPRRIMLTAMMVTVVVGNGLSASAQSYETLLAARFLAGLPHGAFFGLASLAAVSMVSATMRGKAVGTVMLGIPLANLFGVPVATWMGQVFGWRSAYWAVAVIGLLTILLMRLWVPRTEADPSLSWRKELGAFKKSQVWLTLGVGSVGFGGMFAMYSYIAPTVTEVTGQSESWVPVFLFSFGVGSVVGNTLGGRLADWSILRGLAVSGVLMTLLLLLFSYASQFLIPALIVLFLISAFGASWVICLQMRLMSVAGEAKTLGAALNHSALNAANALGAWLGGLVIAGGFGYQAPSLVGAALALAGLLILAVSTTKHVRDQHLIF
ncbi:MFS transporter [Ornithinimicrobium sp. Arc0846-15]|nr:MFS transporter [Ornithinimicrobium laminariae]